MYLQDESIEIMSLLQESRKKKEDFHIRHSYYSRWWNLSGIDDVAILPTDSPFKYVLQTSPFDFWKATMTPEYLVDAETNEYYSEHSKDEITSMVNSMKDIINIIEGEEPHTVAFTSIPKACGDVFELVGLAKISNNGTSFVFCNDLDYIKYLKSKGL
jgi:hypothetical protein